MGKFVRHGSRIVVLGLLAAVPVVAGYGTGSAGIEPAAAYARGNPTPAPQVVKDQYIVTLKASRVARERIGTAASGLVSAYGGTVKHTYTKVHGFAATMNAEAAKKMAGNPDVAAVQPVYRYKAADTQPNPPSWGLDRIDQTYLPYDNSYTYPNTASNVTAYVVDTGIRYSHQDFGGRAHLGFDAFGGDGSDCDGHGTLVSGVVGGATTGVAKAVGLVAVKVLECDGTGDSDTVLQGLEWIATDHDAGEPAVVNMSIVANGIDPAVDAIIASLTAEGVVFVAAAGNGNFFACDFTPGRVGSAITVGATAIDDNRASFSNYGNCIDLFAPGQDITTDFISSDTSTALVSGTSFAAPHVAGVAAMMLSTTPTLTPAQVQQTLVANTNKSHRILTLANSNPPADPLPAGDWHANSPPAVNASSRVVTTANTGRVDAFVASTAPGRPIMHATLTGTTWSAWENLGGTTLGNPTALWLSSNRLVLFATGTDHAAWYRMLESGAWGPWISLGGFVNGADLVVANPEPGTVDVYAIAGDSAVWQRNFDGGGWTPWLSFGGGTSRRNFSVVVDPFNGAEVIFAQGGDGALYYKYFDGGTIPGAWVSLGGLLRWEIKGVATSDGQVDVYVVGNDKAVWHRKWNRATWSGWESLGGVVNGDGVEALGWDNGIVDVYARSTDSRIWTRRFTGGWSGWSQASPELSANVPSATGVLTYQIELAFPRTAGGVHAARWNS